MGRSLSAFLAVVGIAAALFMLGALDSPGGAGDCKQHTVTDALDDYIIAGGHLLVFELEPDDNGATAVAQVSLETCSREDSDACDTLLFDSDYDGTPDTNILTGSGGQRGTPPLRVAGWIRVQSSTNPSGAETGAVVLRVCGV